MLIEEQSGDSEPRRRFTFHHLPDASFDTYGSPVAQPFFDKWGFDNDMMMAEFRVDQPVSTDNFQSMLDSFFQDRAVASVLQRLTRLRVSMPDRVRVRWQPMETKALHMTFFDKMQHSGLITPTGLIQGRLEEEQLDGIIIHNLIREALLLQESEFYDTFSSEDRKEFLYRIFFHLVFGGPRNQDEDHVEEYFKITKAIYKDLVTVRRAQTGDVEVVSLVASVLSLSEGGDLFAKESPLNFCYVIYDPVTRHVKVWYYGWKPW